MNKTQLIWLLLAIAVVVSFGTWRHGRDNHRYYVVAHGRMIGEELIRSTNSIHVVRLGIGLTEYLERFLSSPSAVDDFALGDSPVGDGTANACMFLVNERGERLGIRIKQAEVSQRFHILGYWTASSDAPPNP